MSTKSGERVLLAAGAIAESSDDRVHSLLPRILSLLKGLNGWNQCLGFMTLQELHKDHERRFLIMDAYRLNTMPGVNNDVEEMLLIFCKHHSRPQ